MDLNYSTPGKVKITIMLYKNEMLNDFSEEIFGAPDPSNRLLVWC